MMMRFLSFIFLFTTSSFVFAQDVGMEAEVHITGGRFTAKTSDVTGFATKEGDSYKAKDIKVNLKAVKTGIELRDKHTQNYLDTEKYPEATLTEATCKDGKGKAKIKFRGKEKDVDGTYKVIDDKLLEASFPLKLSEFDITGIRYMGVGVKDDVQVKVTVPIKKSDSKAEAKKDDDKKKDAGKK